MSASFAFSWSQMWIYSKWVVQMHSYDTNTEQALVKWCHYQSASVWLKRSVSVHTPICIRVVVSSSTQIANSALLLHCGHFFLQVRVSNGLANVLDFVWMNGWMSKFMSASESCVLKNVILLVMLSLITWCYQDYFCATTQKLLDQSINWLLHWSTIWLIISVGMVACLIV